MTGVPQKRPAYEPGARLLTPTRYDPEMKRPPTTVTGAALILLRVIAGVVVLVGLAIGWHGFLTRAAASVDALAPSESDAQTALWFVLAAGGTVLVFDALLAVLTFRGHNWARVVVMVLSVSSISTAFATWWIQGQEITLDGALISLSLDILILLALSSRSAAAYARRNERRGRAS